MDVIWTDGHECGFSFLFIYLSPTLIGPMPLIITHQWARDSWCLHNLIHWKGENVNGRSSKWRAFPTIFLCFFYSRRGFFIHKFI